MADVHYTPEEFDPAQLRGMIENVKDDRSDEDLLFQTMLSLGIELSAKIKETTIDGKRVFAVDDTRLLVCFDKDVDVTTIEAMAALHPDHLAIRDACAATDDVLDNFSQVIASHSAEKPIRTHIL